MVLILMMLSPSLHAAPPPVILCLGDSLTAGYGVATAESYPSLLRNRLREQGYNHLVINAGVSGDTTAGGVRRLEWLLRTPPTIAIVALGANDGLRGLDLQEMKQNLAEIIRRLQQAGVRPLLAGLRIPPNYGQPYSEQFAAIYPALAQEKGVPLVPFLLDQVAGYPALNQEDGIHPNAAGYRQLLENIWPLLHPMLP
ncbi:MAG: arylesterase [Magnetococcales bacterium]|nr:arylesterase [Magnetococcales bacterium]